MPFDHLYFTAIVEAYNEYGQTLKWISKTLLWKLLRKDYTLH